MLLDDDFKRDNFQFVDPSTLMRLSQFLKSYFVATS